MKQRFRDFVQRPWVASAALLLAILLVTNVYRAVTQSISHDEGVIYEWLLAGSWGQVLGFEHGNHHVISDLLSKLMISVFGLSELSLRLPALLGGLLYFYSVFRISRLLFGERPLFLLSVAFLSLNPFVLDYLVCARGYGLALGFFFWAISYLTRYFVSPNSSRVLNMAGVALGLSIGSNIIMIFPGIALAVSLLALQAVSAGPKPLLEASVKSRARNPKKKTATQLRPPGWQQALLHFVLPATVVGGVISILPNQLIELEKGYWGPASLLNILEGLVRPSLYHSAAGFAGLAAWFDPQTVVWVVTRLLAPAGLAALLLVAFRILRQPSLDTLPPVSRFLLLMTGTLVLCIALIAVSRYVFHQPYPELRTAIYFIPLFSAAALATVQWLSEPVRIRRILSLGLVSLLLLGVAQYLTQFNTRYFAEWAYCAAGKDMMQALRSDHQRAPAKSVVRIGATWQLEPVLNFYRIAWNLDWVAPVYRQSPQGSFDYYALAYGDTDLVERLNLKVLLRDRLSGTVLAK